jgi:hypothetical protein
LTIKVTGMRSGIFPVSGMLRSPRAGAIALALVRL